MTDRATATKSVTPPNLGPRMQKLVECFQEILVNMPAEHRPPDVAACDARSIGQLADLLAEYAGANAATFTAFGRGPDHEYQVDQEPLRGYLQDLWVGLEEWLICTVYHALTMDAFDSDQEIVDEECGLPKRIEAMKLLHERATAYAARVAAAAAEVSK